MATAVAYMEFIVAFLFLVLLFRVAYILSANPIGELTQELVYLRVGDLRWTALFLVAALLLEIAEFVFPLLAHFRVLDPANVDSALFYLNAIQAPIILVSILLVFLVLARYTHRGLDRRIRESMDTLAYLASQRRRRAAIRAARGEEEGLREPTGKRKRSFE